MTDTEFNTKLKALLRFAASMVNPKCRNDRLDYTRPPFDSINRVLPPPYEYLGGPRAASKQEQRKFTPFRLLYSLLYSIRTMKYNFNPYCNSILSKVIPINVYADIDLKYIVTTNTILFFKLLPPNVIRLVGEVYEEIINRWLFRLNEWGTVADRRIYRNYMGLYNDSAIATFNERMTKLKTNSLTNLYKALKEVEEKTPLRSASKAKLEHMVNIINKSERFSDRFKKMVENRYKMLIL